MTPKCAECDHDEDDHYMEDDPFLTGSDYPCQVASCTCEQYEPQDEIDVSEGEA